MTVIPHPNLPNYQLVTVTRWTNHAKEYVARLLESDPVYRFRREFLPIHSRDWSRSGKNGDTTFLVPVTEGYYEVSDPSTGQYGREARSFYRFDGTDWTEVSLIDLDGIFPPAVKEVIS